MPAIQKRSAQTAPNSPEPKKAKKQSPWQEKVGRITTVLQDNDFEVPGPCSNRQMLIAIAPSVLSTPRDKRDVHMESMVQSFKEVFASEEARLQSKVAEAEATVAAASTELASRKAETESAASELEAKATELKGKLTSLAEDVQATQNSEAALSAVQTELSELEDTKTLLTEEQEVAHARMESFQVLKEGKFEESGTPKEEHNTLKTIAMFLKKIKADVSLVAAVPVALGRKPAERSEFDIIAVTEMQKKLEEKLHDIAAQVHENAAAIVEKTASKERAETALSEARAKQREHAETLLAVKAEQNQLTHNLSMKKQAVVEQEFVLKGLDAEHKEKTIFLTAHQDTQSVLVELMEHETAPEPAAEVPEPVAETPVTMEEMAAEAVPESVQDVGM